MLVSIMALWVGGFLAVAEGWSFLEGFWWSVAAQLGGGMTLSSASPGTRGGRFLGAVAAAWSIGVAALSVGICSSPAIEPLIERLTELSACKACQRKKGDPVVAASA